MTTIRLSRSISETRRNRHQNNSPVVRWMRKYIFWKVKNISC